MAATCRELQRWLSPYLDGALDVDQRATLEVHLQQCRTCATSLESLKKLQRLLRGLGQVEAPQDLLAGVKAKLSVEPWWKRLVAWEPAALPQHRVAVALTAALVIVVVAIPLYLNPSKRKSSSLKLAAKAVSADKEAFNERLAFHGESFGRSAASHEAEEDELRKDRQGTPQQQVALERAEPATQPPAAPIASSVSGVVGELEEDEKTRLDGRRESTTTLRFEWHVPDVALASQEALVAVQAANGHVVQREEHRLVAQLPAERYWAFATSLAQGGRLQGPLGEFETRRIVRDLGATKEKRAAELRLADQPMRQLVSEPTDLDGALHKKSPLPEPTAAPESPVREAGQEPSRWITIVLELIQTE